MTPHVREIDPAPIAVPATPPLPASVQAPHAVKTIVEFRTPPPASIEDEGPSMTDKRRRRRVRLSNRH